MVSDAGQALARQLKEVVVPEFDTYVFNELAEAAKAAGGYATTAITASNAYAQFLAGMEYLGDRNVPDAGRVAFCTYKFANFLKQDPAFMKTGDASQAMVQKGVMSMAARLLKFLPADSRLVLHSCLHIPKLLLVRNSLKTTASMMILRESPVG